MPFNVRKKSNATGKQKIAELIAGMVEDGEHILLDASTTAVYIAKALKSKRNLTVVTNSIEVLIEVSDMTDWNVISLGGSLKEGLSGIGTLQFLGGGQLLWSPEYGGLQLNYAAIHGEDDKKGFENPADEELFLEESIAMLNKSNGR